MNPVGTIEHASADGADVVAGRVMPAVTTAPPAMYNVWPAVSLISPFRVVFARAEIDDIRIARFRVRRFRSDC